MRTEWAFFRAPKRLNCVSQSSDAHAERKMSGTPLLQDNDGDFLSRSRVIKLCFFRNIAINQTPCAELDVAAMTLIIISGINFNFSSFAFGAINFLLQFFKPLQFSIGAIIRVHLCPANPTGNQRSFSCAHYHI